MIGMLRGKIADTRVGQIVLDVNGVGYIVNIPAGTEDRLVIGDELTLFTYLAVREDALTLYGFTTAPQKDLFEKLVGVSGIGPRLGLAILSAYNPSDIQSAIVSGNADLFSSVSGIGKKNAQRIILELKNKVAALATADTVATSPNGELTAALSALGYTMVEAMKASQQVDTTKPLQAQIKDALAVLSKQND